MQTAGCEHIIMVSAIAHSGVDVIGMKIWSLPWTGWWQDRDRRVDVAFALIVGAIEIAGTYFAGQTQPDHRALDAIALALLAAGAAALVFRRLYPGWVLIASMGITLLYLFLDYPKGLIFLT